MDQRKLDLIMLHGQLAIPGVCIGMMIALEAARWDFALAVIGWFLMYCLVFGGHVGRWMTGHDENPDWPRDPDAL
jgi:hypothetical protein